MFSGCTNLTSIKIGYTGAFSTTYSNDWLKDVAPSGTLYYNGSDITRGTYAIPDGWNVKSHGKRNAYIETDGQSYIDLGFVPTSEFRFEA